MTTTTPSFRDLGVSDAVIDTLVARGIDAPFPIQVMVIEDATSGRDTLAKSKTGSGNWTDCIRSSTPTSTIDAWCGWKCWS